jgi:uncharacterized protein (DUF1501 family)
MPPTLPSMNRRQWLARTGLGGAALLGLGSLAALAPARQAHAADYKALVCVFLYGGNDGTNTIVPMDERHGAYAAVRQRLALPKARLLPLGSTGFGLHPAMAALQPAWNAGHLAPVFNVGPLVAPLTKAQYLAAASDSPLLPAKLYSHSDQQAQWETALHGPHARTGWGGRAAEALATVNPVISVGGNGHFGVASLQGPLVVPEPGSAFGATELARDDWRLSYAPLVARADALRALYSQAQEDPLTEALARQQRAAFEVSDRLGGLIQALPGTPGAVAAIDTAFAPLTRNGQLTTPLARQLYQVAKLIAHNATVRGNRQLFFAQQGGFDTHGEQVEGSDPTQGEHAALLGQLADALAAFQAAMVALGLEDAVTAFTQSDFGRTFTPNDSLGTDHAWGNHQLVLGGAVKGGTTYGRYPELTLGGPDDVGQEAWELHGRWIPSTGVDEYAATLLRWFGASETQLDAVLPTLAAFGTRRGLGFV